jgi:hypothetical protein
MDQSGFKSFAPKVIGFSGPLEQLVYAAVSNLGIQVFLKPTTIAEDIFSYKKKQNLPRNLMRNGLLIF